MLLTNNQRDQQISSGQPAKSAIAKDPVKFSTRHWFLTCSCCQETVLSSCVLSTFCCKLGNLTIKFRYALVKVASAWTAPGPAEWNCSTAWKTNGEQKTWNTRVPSSPIPITTWSPVSRCLPNLDRLCDPVCWASSGTTLLLWWFGQDCSKPSGIRRPPAVCTSFFFTAFILQGHTFLKVPLVGRATKQTGTTSLDRMTGSWQT